MYACLHITHSMLCIIRHMHIQHVLEYDQCGNLPRFRIVWILDIAQCRNACVEAPTVAFLSNACSESHVTQAIYNKPIIHREQQQQQPSQQQQQQQQATREGQQRVCYGRPFEPLEKLYVLSFVTILCAAISLTVFYWCGYVQCRWGLCHFMRGSEPT